MFVEWSNETRDFRTSSHQKSMLVILLLMDRAVISDARRRRLSSVVRGCRTHVFFDDHSSRAAYLLSDGALQGELSR